MTSENTIRNTAWFSNPLIPVSVVCASILTLTLLFAWLNPKTATRPMCGCEREGHACMCIRK